MHTQLIQHLFSGVIDGIISFDDAKKTYENYYGTTNNFEDILYGDIKEILNG